MHLTIFAFLLLSSLSLAIVPTERPEHCLEPHPEGAGPCRMLLAGFYFEPSTKRCERWTESGCRPEGGNSYNSLKECEDECLKPGMQTGSEPNRFKTEPSPILNWTYT